MINPEFQTEVILNIYLIVEEGMIIEYRAYSYVMGGRDDIKRKFLKTKAPEDFERALSFEAPINKKGKFMSLYRYLKLARRRRHFALFRKIFIHFKAPKDPMINVTFIINGKIADDDAIYKATVVKTGKEKSNKKHRERDQIYEDGYITDSNIKGAENQHEDDEDDNLDN